MKKILFRDLKGDISTISGSATFLSLWQPLDAFEKYMIQVVYTGSPVASVSLVVSADKVLPLWDYASTAAAAPINYDTVSSSVISTASVSLSPSGSYIITYEVVASAASWVAVRIVNASGSGVVSAINFVGKGSQT